MPTFLLTWNPARRNWPDLAEVARQTGEGTPYSTRWSTGNTKRIVRGDRVFLLKQGEEPRGIMAAGRVTSERVYDSQHFDAERAAQGDTALRVDVVFERILNPAIHLPLAVENVKIGAMADVYWHLPASGIELSEPAAGELKTLWAGHLDVLAHAVGEFRGAELSPDDGDTFDPEVPYVLTSEDSRVAVLRRIKARRGQQGFRDALRSRYGDQCMISGCRLMDVVEASHIKPHRSEQDNHPANGLLLRADLHTLFDLDFIGIEPDTLKVHVHPDARAAGYDHFDGLKLLCGECPPNPDALAHRWEAFKHKTKR